MSNAFKFAEFLYYILLVEICSGAHYYLAEPVTVVSLQFCVYVNSFFIDSSMGRISRLGKSLFHTDLTAREFPKPLISYTSL